MSLSSHRNENVYKGLKAPPSQQRLQACRIYYYSQNTQAIGKYQYSKGKSYNFNNLIHSLYYYSLPATIDEAHLAIQLLNAVFALKNQASSHP